MYNRELAFLLEWNKREREILTMQRKKAGEALVKIGSADAQGIYSELLWVKPPELGLGKTAAAAAASMGARIMPPTPQSLYPA